MTGKAVVITGAVVIGLLILSDVTRDRAPPVVPGGANVRPAAETIAIAQTKQRERQAAFDADKPKIMAELRRLMNARKYEEASKYANDYYDVDSPELRAMQADADKRLSDALIVKAKATAKKEGVRVGMTKEQALGSSWGKPTSINTTTNRYGSHEQWVYGNRSYLYFDGDLLTSIQN